MERRKKRLERALEREEEDRVARRAAERAQRCALRIAGYEANERRLMEIEDDRSLMHRFYLWEPAQEDDARESMWDAELEQCELDRFWGFEVFEARKRAEEERLREFYRNRVREVNELLVMTEAIRPFKLEAGDVEDFRVQFELSPFKMKAVHTEDV